MIPQDMFFRLVLECFHNLRYTALLQSEESPHYRTKLQKVSSGNPFRYKFVVQTLFLNLFHTLSQQIRGNCSLASVGKILSVPIMVFM